MDEENGISTRERERRIPSPAGQRLVAAARESVRERGVAGTTFERIAPDANVSLGSIAWYFGTKERLLAEVMRSDADHRLERMRARLDPPPRATNSSRPCALLEEFLDSAQGPQVVLGEMTSLSLRHETFRATQVELRQRLAPPACLPARARSSGE